MMEYGRVGPFHNGDRLLDQYEVVRLLGVGGHAYVYECRDSFLDERLAIKVIPNPPNRGRDLLNRARAEAQLLRRLSHPNVVRMHTAAALGDDMVCLIMEKLSGVSLRHLLVLLGPLNLVEATAITRQVAAGVAAAHELNVVHRDIKPDNIFVLPPNNQVKVLDFGIAKFLGQAMQTSSKHRFQGTPLYMSPEHLQGVGVTIRSDVYQLGTVLFELLAGINPNLIEVHSPSFEQVALVQITRPTPALTRIVPGIPEALDRLVQRATAKDALARFATMAEFIDALDEVMQRHLANFPEAARTVRYVDSNLMQAAASLGDRELASATKDQNTVIAQRGVASTHSSWRSSTLRLDASSASIDALAVDTEPREPVVPAIRLAAFHPVPQLAPGSTFVGSRHAAVFPTRIVAVTFVLVALGIGAIAGSFALWLGRRGVAVVGHTAMPPTSASSGSDIRASVAVRAELSATSAVSSNGVDAATVARGDRHDDSLSNDEVSSAATTEPGLVLQPKATSVDPTPLRTLAGPRRAASHKVVSPIGVPSASAPNSAREGSQGAELPSTDRPLSSEVE